ncbi:HIT domain-containing protein [bacterium]|nr:HIT domain-containing protein [bacterium]
MKKRRPVVECILCSIVQGDTRVESLKIWQNEIISVSANLYPYNAGHLLIFPIRHIRDYRQMSQEENSSFFQVTKACLDALDKLYEPLGFNIGFNINDASGASIDHLHQHIVPRYFKELGFVDIISGTKIIIEDPLITMQKIKGELVPRLKEF